MTIRRNGTTLNAIAGIANTTAAIEKPTGP